MAEAVVRNERTTVLMSDEQRVLIIAFTENNDSIRIISARETSRSERETYEHG